MDEQGRLNALSTYALVDTLPEKDYDDITRIAAMICNTPIALVSLVNDTKQFFKSHQGLDVSETPREIAFCTHAIQKPSQLMMVPDARNDHRFMDNPLVTGDPHIVFYAGMPLVTPDGYALGTLCVIDNKPHALNLQQQEALQSLSRQVMNLFELRKKNALLLRSQQQLHQKAVEMESFAHAASHDLREPLRMVKSFLGLLTQKYAADLTSEARKYIDFAVDGADRMDLLLIDLLDFARAGSLNSADELTDLNEILTEVKKLLALTITEKQAIITSQSLPVVKASSTAMRQLLQNLLSNALKYQAPGVKPVINISGSENQTHWEFKLEDNGIGIPREEFKTIFTVFKRLHRKEEYPGTGVGLAICKKIVERYGGEIRVESEPGTGSVFYFTISKIM